MTQVIYEKELSCLLCGAYKASDGWDYAKQMCECGFGKLPTAEEIENDDYSTHQVQNLRRELEAAERREFKERDTRKGLELELTHRYEQIESLTQQNAELEEECNNRLGDKLRLEQQLASLREAAQTVVDRMRGSGGINPDAADALLKLAALLKEGTCDTK